MMHSKKTRNKSHSLFWYICNWNELSGEKWFICSFWFFFFFFFFVGFYHLHVISDWFSDIFPPKILHFCSLSDSKLQETNFKRLISQNQIFRKTVYKVLFTNDHILKSRMSMNFGIKLDRPKVCSSQWYQKLILPRISLVSCFDGVPHKCVLISPLWARIN